MFKQLADIAGALAGLILAMPFVLIAVLLILLFDWQNPFFLQERLGKFKMPFTIFKLRTMKNGVVTRLGNVLRKTGIDELPQLLNILFLQMSFVGPRPLTQADADRWGWADAYHAKRWNLRPGLTGLAQLSPVCHRKMSWFLDQKYIACQTIGLDLKILFSSVAVLFLGKRKVIQWMHPNRRYAGTR